MGKIVARIAAPLLIIGLTVAALWRRGDIAWGEWVWLSAFWAQLIIRAPHARRNATNTVSADSKDLPERVVLAAMFICMAALPLTEVGTDILGFADYALPTWAMAIGTALQVPFLWLFWRSHTDIGRNWSATLEIREGHDLVTNGVYARIRHPMYAAIWCSVLAQPLLIQNWIAGLPVIAAFWAMWIVRMPREEQMMRDTFGEAYDAYCRRSGRIWPARTVAAAATSDRSA